MAEDTGKKKWFEATKDIDEVLSLVGCKMKKGQRVLLDPRRVSKDSPFKRVDHGNVRAVKRKAEAEKRAKDNAAAKAAANKEAAAKATADKIAADKKTGGEE